MVDEGNGSAFGRLLLRHRRVAGLSQEGLARASGMSVRALRELEKGRARAAQARSAEVLADGLGLAGSERESFLAVAREGRRRSPQVSEAMALCALPPVVADLVGRDRELGWLRAEAVRGRVVAVVGHPGVGKTAVAVAAAHELAPGFPGGSLAVDLRGTGEEPLSAPVALDKLLRALGVPAGRIPAEQDEKSNLLAGLAESRGILLLLDNATDEAQVRPLLVTGQGCLTLVTSRGALAGLESVRRLWVEPLDSSAAVGLLAETAGAGRVAAEPEAARELVGLCGSLPLAVRIVGNRLATRPHWSLAYLVSQLRDERVRLGSLSVGDLQVRSAFEVSYRRLSSQARLVFRRLAVVPGADFGAELAAVATGLGSGEVQPCLDELADASLLQAAPEPGRFHLHDLVRIFANERLEAEETPDSAGQFRDILLDHLLTTAAAAARLFLPDGLERVDTGPFSILDEAAEWLARERSNWVAAQRVAAGLGRHREVLELASAMHWYADSRMPERPWDQIFALGLDAARALDSRSDEARMLNQLGWAHYMCLGDSQAALPLHLEALAVARQVGDRLEQAWAHAYLALALVRTGSIDQGLEHARQGDAVALEVGDVPLRLSMRNVRGLALRAEGRDDEALSVHRAVLDEMRTHRDETNLATRWMTAVVQDEIGLCLVGLKEWRSAAAAHRDARVIFATVGLGYREAQSAAREGVAWREAGEYALARECLRLALEFFTGPLYQDQRERALAELAGVPELG
jgi:transcriptional regulator with XRE-family HTH domain/tetratricopeptide (TPR) repeat protein